MVVAIVVAYYTGYYQFAGGSGVFGATSTGLAGGLAAFGNAVISGAALSGISAGSWKAAGQGALSGALFWGAGSIGEAKSFAEGGWQMTALHAAAGCVSAEASGGDCGRAALSAGFAQFAGGNMPSWGSDAANLFRQAILGGTASYLAGGKFANGAATAAFAYLYSDLAHAWAGSEATRTLGQYLNGRDGAGTWTVDKGSFFNIFFGGRPDFIHNPTGQIYELKTNNCSSKRSARDVC